MAVSERFLPSVEMTKTVQASAVRSHFQAGMILMLLSRIVSSSHVTIVPVGMDNSFIALLNPRSSLSKIFLREFIGRTPYYSGENGGSIFLDLVNPLMHFRIGTMSGKINRNGIDFLAKLIPYTIDLLIEFIFNTIDLLIERFDFEIHEFDLFRQLLPCVPDLFAKRLMAFSDNVQFVLEMFGLDSNLMAKLGFDFLLEVTDDLFEAFEIFTIHYGYPLSQLNGRYP